MTVGQAAGAIWYRQVDFRDGRGVQKKYFILLNDCAPGESYFAVFTTSQPRYAVTAKPCGCPDQSCYRLEPNEVSLFTLRTFVQFDNPFETTPAQLDGWASEGSGGFLHVLDDERLRSILACASKSIDIPNRHLQRIARTLKAKLEKRKADEAKARATKVAEPRQPFASTASMEVLQIRTLYVRRCTPCQTQFEANLEITGARLQKIFSGAEQPPDDFARDAGASFELLVCATCAT